MSGRVVPPFAALLGFAFCLAFGTGLSAQQPYNSRLQAGQDAYQAAEEQRQAAIEMQLRLNRDLRWQNTWAYPPRVPTLAEVYASPYGQARRAYRQALRYGYPPIFQPWPRVPGDIYGYPYYGYQRQPIGHERLDAGPNGYAYRPLYAVPRQPVAPQGQPTPAPPQPGIAPDSPETSVPEAEAIPAPPSEPGPREF